MNYNFNSKSHENCLDSRKRYIQDSFFDNKISNTEVYINNSNNLKQRDSYNPSSYSINDSKNNNKFSFINNSKSFITINSINKSSEGLQSVKLIE